MKKASATILALLLALALLPACLPQGQPGMDFETALPVDLSTGPVTLNGSLTKTFEDNHYYKLTGVSSGMEVKVEAMLEGIESGLTTISIYSPERARLVGSDQVLGKGSLRKITLSYLLGYDPKHPEPYLYLRVGKSRGALNYTVEISLEERFDAGSGRDAGDSMASAVQAPSAAPGMSASFRGHLSDKDRGNDYMDFYRLSLDLQPGQVIHVSIDPAPDLMIEATLLASDGFSLRHNQSAGRGMPVTMSIKGDWTPGANTFYLQVGNLGGRGGGGEYTVELSVLAPPTETTATTAGETTAQPWPPIGQETARNLIIAIAVALVAAAAAILIIRRRRRVVKVEEEEWGGWETGEEGWEEGW